MTAASAVAAAPAALKLVDDNQASQMNANAADVAFEIVDQFSKSTRLSWWELGKAVLGIQENGWFANYKPEDGGNPYHSLEDFINRKLQKGRSTAYRAKKLREELSTLSDDEASRIPLVKAMWLYKLKKRAGDSKWANPKWVKKACDPKISEDAFAELVNAALPGAAKEEQQIVVKFTLDKSQAKRFAKALKTAKKIYETEHDNETLEAITEFFMQGRCEKATFVISNEEFADGKKHAAKKSTTKKH